MGWQPNAQKTHCAQVSRSIALALSSQPQTICKYKVMYHLTENHVSIPTTPCRSSGRGPANSVQNYYRSH